MNAYKIGDEIAYTTSRTRYSACFIRFDKIIATTKTTITTENGRRFNLSGAEMKTATCQYPSARLMKVDDAREIISREKRLHDERKTIAELQHELSRRNRFSDNELKAIALLTDMLQSPIA